MASLLLWSAATAGSGLSASPGAFLFWRVIMGLTEALYFPAAAGLIATLHRERTRSTALAAHQSAQLIGIVAGGWYGGWAADHVGWRTGFLAIALAGVVYGAVLAAGLHRADDSRTAAAGGGPSWMPLFRSPCFLAMAAAFFAFCAMLWMIYAWLPSYLYDRHGLSMTESGFVATVYVQLSSGAGALAGGKLADCLARSIRAGRFYVACAGLLLSPPFAYAAFLATSLAGMKIASALFGLCAGLMIGNVFAATYDVVPEHAYGAATGALNTIGALGGGLAVLLAGLYKATLGTPALVGCAGLATACAGAFLVAVAATRLRRERLVQA